MTSLPDGTRETRTTGARRAAIWIERGPSLKEWQAWEEARVRAVRRAIPAAEERARRNRVSGPVDLLGDPIDPTKAGRVKAERAHLIATGFPTVHPAEIDDPRDAICEQIEDECWELWCAALAALLRWSR